MLCKFVLFVLAASVAQSSQPASRSTASGPATRPASASQPAGRATSQPCVFDLPRLQVQYAILQAQTGELFRQGRYTQAEGLIRSALTLVPQDLASHYNLACCLARQGRADEAMAALEQAVDLGYNDSPHMAGDADLVSLRDRAEFKALLGRALLAKPDPQAAWKYDCHPAQIEDGVAWVREGNTAWDTRLGQFRVLFHIADKSSKPIAVGMGEAGDLLRKWAKEGTAAGNQGDLYDNHDSDHSNMNYGAFPQLARIEYDDQARKRSLHHGLQVAFLFDHPTLGNSSTALTSGPLWRSQPRYALTNPRSAGLLYVQYVTNHIYFYPEHRDHDPGHDGADGKGHGDLIPANTPYMIISQGSSGSDVAFMNAVAATMAAFRPEVKHKLVQTGTLTAAVQMVFRQSNKMVQKPEDYLTGQAHPSVFDGGQIDVVKMVRLAHEIVPGALPPMIQLRVVEEDQPVCGVDFFDAPGRTEKLLDTPCAIARVARSVRYMRRMVVSAEASKDLQGKPLQYRWAVLQGDASRIKINNLKADGSVVELLVPYHERRPIQEGSELESNRVDIGAFVNNGTWYSAPGFVSVLFLDNQKRSYDPKGRLLSVDYAAPVVSKHYVDPLLDLPKSWRDDYVYDQAGKMTGWTRTRGKDKQEFTADGKLVVHPGDQGRPAQTRAVTYAAKSPSPGRPAVLVQE